MYAPTSVWLLALVNGNTSFRRESLKQWLLKLDSARDCIWTIDHGLTRSYMKPPVAHRGRASMFLPDQVLREHKHGRSQRRLEWGIVEAEVGVVHTEASPIWASEFFVPEALVPDRRGTPAELARGVGPRCGEGQVRRPHFRYLSNQVSSSKSTCAMDSMPR
jgi:hypothetical protein